MHISPLSHETLQDPLPSTIYPLCYNEHDVLLSSYFAPVIKSSISPSPPLLLTIEQLQTAVKPR